MVASVAVGLGVIDGEAGSLWLDAGDVLGADPVVDGALDPEAAAEAAGEAVVPIGEPEASRRPASGGAAQATATSPRPVTRARNRTDRRRALRSMAPFSTRGQGPCDWSHRPVPIRSPVGGA